MGKAIQHPDRGQGLVKFAAAAWYTPILIGQFVFAAYILYTYGWPLLGGDLASWNKHLSEAYIPGRSGGNLAVMAHLALGVVIHIGGPLQLVPAVRKRFPGFHRWTGRAFVISMVIGVASGAYMLMVREIGAWTLQAGFVAQGAFILWFTVVAVRFAIARDIENHMRWATRLFLAASAVWFFRTLIMIWFVLTGGLGIDTSDGTGWFMDVMSLVQFLPLAVFEVYWRVRDRGSFAARLAMAAFLWASAALFAVGVFLATFGMWFPILG